MSTTIYEQVPNVKIVLLGESTVGKTSIINVVHGGQYIQDQPTTIGACFYIKKMKINDVTVKLHIWDTAGQERFRSLAPMYYRDAQYALLVYAVNNDDSFKAIQTWYDGLVQNCSTLPKVVLIGNKIDLETERTVTTESGKQLAQQLKADFYEVSAKTNKESVDKVFEQIVEDTVKEINATGNQEHLQTTDLTKTSEKGKKCC